MSDRLDEILSGRTSGDSMDVSYLRGRSVLVTGAGGSIGSELCRQLARAPIRELILVEIHECALYQIERDVASLNPGLTVIPLLVDIRHEHVLRHVFWRHRPNVVMHAAALKHVPMLESPHNAIEAVRTNVFGTRRVLDEARRCPDTDTVVVISTDKAVNPTSWMGATKRCVEKIVFHMAVRTPEVSFAIVRFGNVVGSSGSVVPLFREQLEAGGPLTVTHPDITRYIMSISEAVGLVLHATKLGEDSQDNFGLFVLDMGGAVRILDLAKRMIETSGRQDVDVKFIGLRPGEKLYEELFYPHEKPVGTSHAMISRASMFLTTTLLAEKLQRLERVVDRRDIQQVREALLDIVPEYTQEGV